MASIVKKVKHLSRKEKKEIEQVIKSDLESDDSLTEVPDLLGCDINYYTAGLTLKTYQCNPQVYLHITEGLRAEILENGPITRDSFILLWLLRESGCTHDLFSLSEQNTITRRMQELLQNKKCWRILWEAEYHNSLELMANTFIVNKRSLFKNPYLQGVSLLYPFFDRRSAIFVDLVVLGTTVNERRSGVKDFLIKHGHQVEEIANGTETLLKIDNQYYRIFPRARSYGRVPVQGVQLLPFYH